MPENTTAGTVIVISSHVVRGSVGNRAAVFALETLGHQVWALPTVVLPWHPGHGRSTRLTFAEADFDAAIDEANSTRFGLAASVLTKDPALYDRFWANVRSGVINWNKPTNGAPSNALFGGVGMSGNHRPSAFYAADYCAYPVTSVEADMTRAVISEGLREAYVPEGG